MVLEGADAVRQTCHETLESLEDTTTIYDRCVMAVDDGVVAVDTLARYAGPNGVTTVASCRLHARIWAPSHSNAGLPYICSLPSIADLTPTVPSRYKATGSNG